MIDVIDKNRIVGDSSGMVILRIFCHPVGPVDVGRLAQRLGMLSRPAMNITIM